MIHVNKGTESENLSDTPSGRAEKLHQNQTESKAKTFSHCH